MHVRTEQERDLKTALEALFPAEELQLRIPRPSRSGPDFVAVVPSPAGRLRLLIEFMSASGSGRLRDAAEHMHRRPPSEPHSLRVLAAKYLSPAQQEWLRRAGVPFLDLAGNAWLAGERLLIDRRGFANPDAHVRLPRGAFSDKASLVVRSLVDSPQGRGIRELAGALDLSPGYVSKVVKQLDRSGYIAKGPAGVSLRHVDELLDDWVHAYRGREPAFSAGFFVLAPSAEELLGQLGRSEFAGSERYALTGQAGAHLLAPYAEFDRVDVYVREQADAELLAAQLGARPADRGANLQIMIPYYRISAFFACQRAQELRVVSDLQLYLDLYDFPVRGREQAEHLYTRRLAPKVRALAEVGSKGGS